MASHNELGKEAEEMAVDYLVNDGFSVLSRNWRHSKAELDIIAEKNGMLHIIEVKSRKGNYGGYPEQSVTKKKFKHLTRAAEEYLFNHPEYKDIRFDVLSINIYSNKKAEYFLINDVFL